MITIQDIDPALPTPVTARQFMPQDQAFVEAEREIQRALRDDAVSLDLSGRGLRQLPESLGQLTNLQRLDLSKNQLSAVPECLGQLTNLQRLDLDHNQLSAVPESLGQLTNLKTLDLDQNQLSTVPESLGQLTNLKTLYLYQNQLSTVPDSLGQLTSLQTLYLGHNQLSDSMREAYEQGTTQEFLAYLRELGSAKGDEKLYETKLVLVGEGEVGKSCLVTALNEGKFNPKRPTTHGIEITPLTLPHPEGAPDITVNCWDFGGQDVYRVTHQFFFSPRSLYVVVWHPRRGADNSRVEDWIELIQRRVGQGFRVLVVASHCDEGRYPRIDAQRLETRFPGVIAGFHDIDSETGTGIAELRALIAREAAQLPQMGEPFPVSWREVRDDLARSRSPKLEWKSFERKCRQYEVARDADEALANLLDALGHIIYFGDDPSLSDLVVLKPEWLSKAIGLVLEDGPTIEANGILDHARLPGIWNDEKRKKRDRYPQAKLYPFFLRLMEKFDVSYRIPDSNDQRSLVGELVQKDRPPVRTAGSAAAGSPRGADDSSADDSSADDSSADDSSAGGSGAGGSGGGNGERALWWDHGTEPCDGWHRLQLILRLNDDPPGLVPWLIVRNHRFNAARLHWREGVFLESDHGQALIELRDRQLLLTVHGSYPSNMRGMMQSSVEEVLKIWEGLKGRWQWRVPCRTVHADGTRCQGTLLLSTLQTYQARGVALYPCETCATEQDISDLVSGFPSPEPEKRLRAAEQKLDKLTLTVHSGFTRSSDQMKEAAEHREELHERTIQEIRSIASESVRLILKAFENRQSPCPRVFTLLPAKLEGWENVNPAEWLSQSVTQRFRLTLWCEMPGEEHPTCPIGSAGSRSKPREGEYVFRQTREWFGTVARYTSLIGKVLGVVAPVAKNAAELFASGPGGLEEALRQIDAMKSLGDAARQLEENSGRPMRRHLSSDGGWPGSTDDFRAEPFREIVEAAEHCVFLSLLRDLDKQGHYGQLRWTLDKASGDWLWLCPTHFKIFNPDLPVIPPDPRTLK